MGVCDRITMTAEEEESTMSKNTKTTVQSVITTSGWGLFFVWIGVAVLSNVGWGVGLLGVGIITLGAQVARKYFGLRLEGFWVVVGLFFVLGGIWELLNVRLGLLPVLCIAAGVALLVFTLIGKPRHPSLCRLR